MKSFITRLFSSFVPAFVLRALRLASYHREPRPSATCNPQQSAGGAGIVRPRYPSVIAHAGTGYLAGLSPVSGTVPQECTQPFSPQFRADLERATRDELRAFQLRRHY
jgi:hypothetical protein